MTHGPESAAGRDELRVLGEVELVRLLMGSLGDEGRARREETGSRSGPHGSRRHNRLETTIRTGRASPAYGGAIARCATDLGRYLLRVAVETKTADARVECRRVDLRSYEARNGASLARSFLYNFRFPSMYRRLNSTRLIQ